MKNLIVITLSLFLVHFNWSPTTEAVLKIDGFTLSKTDHTPENPISEEVVVAGVAKQKNETGTHNITSFKAKTTADIQSVENSNNRSFHQQLIKKTSYQQAESLQYYFDDYELKNSETFNILLQFADKLIFDSSLKVSISGNADAIGNGYYNDVLSYNRVENVRAYLLEIGVLPQQIILSFNGTNNPVTDNQTEDGRAQNRRVEIVLYR